VIAISELTVRPLAVDDLDDYLRCMEKVHVTSGVNGAGHSHPYQRTERFDMESRRERELTGWSAEIGQPDWRRAWGLIDHDEIVGELSLTGGSLASEMHRVGLGMGIVSTHQRRGGGSMLLRAAIAWATDQPGVDWIDLGVFSDNPGAHALYRRVGFVELGTTPDRFRIDGLSIDDTSMTLDVSAPQI
jgi:RimJ/RimL family protein N-acetyltransferase